MHTEWAPHCYGHQQSGGYWWSWKPNWSQHLQGRVEWAREDCFRLACIRGYHVYKEVWEAAAGEMLICEREPRNVHDRYAVAV